MHPDIALTGSTYKLTVSEYLLRVQLKCRFTAGVFSHLLVVSLCNWQKQPTQTRCDTQTGSSSWLHNLSRHILVSECYFIIFNIKMCKSN